MVSLINGTLRTQTDIVKALTTNSDQDTIVYTEIGDAEQKKFHINPTYVTLFDCLEIEMSH